MKKLVLGLTFAFALSLGIFGVSHVFARDGTSNSTESTQTSSTDSSTTTSSSIDEKAAEALKQAQEKAAEAKKKESERVAEAQKKEDEKKKEDRQKTCDDRKAGINKKIEKLSANAQKHQDTYTALLNKAIDYKNTNNLSPTNFDTLVATAQAAQTTSQNSINTFKASSIDVDCTNEGVAAQVQGIKTLADTTKTNLKAYRTAVKAVLQTLEPAQTESQ